MTDYWIEDSIKTQHFENVYDLGTKLGHGATAVVHVCTHKGTKQTWAVKIIEKKVDKKVVKRECGVLLKIMHDNIIRLKEIFETESKIWMVLEFVKGGELFDRIVSKGFYSEIDAAKCVREMLEGVKFLHENNICHRDLKPENLLLSDTTEDAVVKIADFGLAEMSRNEVQMSLVCGTPGYCAPEVLQHKGYGKEVDLWSVGVIAYILLCGYEPFFAETDAEIYKKILKGQLVFDSPWWDEISYNARNLVEKLLTMDPKKRLTAEQALRHDWVQGSANRNKHMESTQTKLKELQARKKLKAVTAALHLTSGWEQIISQSAPEEPKQDMNLNQALMGLAQVAAT